MRSSGRRARVAVATIAIWLSVCTAAAAQTARERYESAVERDAKVRAQLTGTTGRTVAPDLAAELRQAITAFEIVVRRFPTSGYADNALFQAASLADTAYEKFNRPDDRERALKFYRWLVQEYPGSTLVSRANAKLELLTTPVVIERATLTDIQRTVMAEIGEGDARARSGGRVSRTAAQRAGTRVFRLAERATDADVARHGADVSQRRGQQDPHRPPSRSRGARCSRSRRCLEVQRVYAVQPVPPGD